MNHNELAAWLGKAGFPLDKSPYMSKHLLRVADASRLLPGVGSPAPAAFVGIKPPKHGYQIRSLGDALYWHRSLPTGTSKTLHLVLANHGDDNRVFDALGTLAAAYQGDVEICFCTINYQRKIRERTFQGPDFSGDDPGWADLLRKRVEKAPDIARQLCEAVGDHSFRWYRNLSASSWSGRADGLQLCQLSASGPSPQLELKVGTIDKKGARPAFLRVMEQLGITNPYKINLDVAGLESASTALVALIQERREGGLQGFDLEHRLEARILRGEVPLGGAMSSGSLVPLDADPGAVPFQFPARWSRGDKKRHVDILARQQTPGADPDIPWVVELKRKKRSRKNHLPQDYRHAVSQVVLYREFLRQAEPLDFWFEEQGLDPKRFQAAVAFPHEEGARAEDQAGVFSLAEDFGVEVIELDC